MPVMRNSRAIDDHGHPGGDAGDGDVLELGEFLVTDEFGAGEKDKAATDEDLVDKGIDDAAEGGLHMPMAGQITIEHIRDAGDDEDDEGPPHGAGKGIGLVDVEERKEEGRQEETGDGDEVGDLAIHVKENSKRETQKRKKSHEGPTLTCSSSLGAGFYGGG